MKLRILVLGGLAAAGLTFALQSAHADTTLAPPDLADETAYLTNTVTVTLPGDLATVRAAMDTTPITDFLRPTDRIPAIDGFTVLEGTWGEPGAVRRVDLADGSTVMERVLTNDADEFSYQIWAISTAEGRFIDHIYGRFDLTEVTGETTIAWSYNVKPTVFFARPSIRGFLENDFAPFMEGGMSGFVDAYIMNQPS